MNEKLFKKLLYTGQISLEKGNFSAIGHRFVFLPPEFFVFLAEQFSKVASVKKARTAIYGSAKEMSRGLGNDMLKNRLEKKEVPGCMAEILSAYGWGNANILEQNESSMLVYYKNSPRPLMPDGSNICRAEVCEFIKGSLAGIFEIASAGKADCKETKCVIRGDQFCQFLCSTKKG